MQTNSPNLIEVPLDEILENNGYFKKREKSSRNYKTLSNDNGDTIVVSQLSNGHYVYFNPNNQSDRGNIFNFCKNRGISANDLTQGRQDIYLKLNRENNNITNSQNLQKIIMEYRAMPKISEVSFLSQKRKIAPQTIQQFNSIKQDNQNVVFASYGLSSGEKVFLRQIGTMTYLAKPITKDKEGVEHKPIKQLCSGKKGLEILKADELKSLRDVRKIVICESMIDSLSYFELNGLSKDETLLCSTNGQITKEQKEVFKYLNKMANKAEIFLCFDKDEKGIGFGKTTKEIMPNAKVIKPVLKDFNDDLVVKKALKIEKMGLQILKIKLLEFSKNTDYLNKKFDILYKQAKKEKIKEYLKFMPTFLTIKEKVGGVFDVEKIDKNCHELKNKLGINKGIER